MDEFNRDNFEHGLIKFKAAIKPVSSQNKGKTRKAFKKKLQQITCKSDCIVTDSCWVTIDSYCQTVKRLKNPNVYDIDNIVKPILDALVGKEGLIIDDAIVDRVTVNWIDTPHDDYFQLEIEYPNLRFTEKESLIFLQSKSGWCLPSNSELIKNETYIELVKSYFDTWNAISTEEDYCNAVGTLPVLKFIYHTKIRDRGFDFYEI